MSTLPSICGITAGILLARRSDAGGERCWHFVFGACVGALGFVLATISPTNPAAVIASLCVTWAGLSGAYGLTWVIPSKVLVGRHSATGYALISVIQGAAGFVGPVMIAYIKTATGSFDLGLYAMATTSLAAALVCICFYYVLPTRAPAPKLT